MSDSDLESGEEGGGGPRGFDVPFDVLARGGNACCIVIEGFHFFKDWLAEQAAEAFAKINF